MLESGKGSARPFPSEPEGPQGEEGVASRASRHENAEALVFASFFSYFHPIFRFNPFTAVSQPGGFRGGFRVTLLGFMQ